MKQSGFQVGPATWVRLRYSAVDEEGEPVEEQPQEIGYVHGFGVLFPGLEAAVEGRRAGETARVVLEPHDAFGPRREDRILECAPEEFPADAQPGDRLEAENQEGAVMVLRVLEVSPEAVVVDTNHPLAGQRVTFELTVLEVRPASAGELAEAEARMAGSQTAEGPLIPVQRLLQGPSQRYERGPSAAGPQPSPDDEET